MASVPVGRRRIILLLILTAVLLLTMDVRGNRFLDGARSVFVWALAPVETAIKVVARPVGNAWNGITNYGALEDENVRLQELVDSQRGAEVAARNAVAENQRLRALNELASLADIESVTASIIGQSPSNVDQIVEIDRGSRQGIAVGMAVVNEAGLVGKVTRVFSDASLVMLVTDPRYAVEVKVLSAERPLGGSLGGPSGSGPIPPTTTPSGLSEQDLRDARDVLAGPSPGVTTTTEPVPMVQRETGALIGQGPDRLPQINFVTNSPSLGRILEGDPVFTSGGRNSLAPPDIPVGVVANVIQRPGSGGTRLEVRLSASVNQLQFVRVLLYRPPAEAEE
jgi:rod shape-determining protein MreC